MFLVVMLFILQLGLTLVLNFHLDSGGVELQPILCS